MAERSEARAVPIERAAPGAGAKTRAFYKSGTIERLYRWHGDSVRGKLHGMSKSIAADLIGRAQEKRGYTCLVSDEELAADMGDVDRKTIAKYIKPLVDMKLVSYKRKGDRGVKLYDCMPLFLAFGEERIEPKDKVTDLRQMRKDSPSSQMTKNSPSEGSVEKSDGESFPADAETFPPDGETFPVDGESLDVSNSSSSFVSTFLTVDALRAELEIDGSTTGLDVEIFAIGDYLRRWKTTPRFRRQLVKRYGIVRLAGAVAYVVQQQRILPAGSVKDPVGLVRYALGKGYSSSVPERGPEEEGQMTKVSPTAESPSIADALWAWMSGRDAFFVTMFRRDMTIEVENGAVHVGCPTKWAAEQTDSRRTLFADAAKAVLGIDVTVILTTRERP